MKKVLFVIFISVTVTLTAKAQNFVFIGENSYPSTDTFVLQSNYDDEDITDLNIVFAKDGEEQLLVVSSKLSGSVKIAEKLIIYLDDGTVITCNDKGINDNVNEVAMTAYYLTDENLAKMKNSNLNTVRYQIVCPICGPINSWEGTYSASNKGSKINFPSILSDFFKE